MNAVNAVGFLLALVLAAAGVAWVSPARETAPEAAAIASPSVVRAETMSDGTPAVRDARGALVPIRSFQRIVALDLVSDELLGQLVEPRRIAAVSLWNQGPEAWRHDGLPRLPGLTDLEAVLRLKPDLVLVSTFGGETDRIQRLREGGLAVFDLGPAGGLRELTGNLRRIALLTGTPERGERLAAQLERRMQAIAAHLPPQAPRRRALVLNPVVDQVYGGTTGTSFHDIVLAAGLVDAAEGHFAEPWPRIGAEAALQLDPDLIVTRQGAAAELRRQPGFANMRALREPGGVIELPYELFDSPGLSMLDAAERLFAETHR
jgi:iron complex transport system substrate-binding protein